MTPRQFTHDGRPVPYITAWTGELHTTPRVVQLVHRGVTCVGYPIEQMTDRDERERLWARQEWAPGCGEPKYEAVHTLRQRHVMRHLLCQICSGPTQLNEDNDHLWLLGARRSAQGPVREGDVTASPPICRPCASTSLKECPELGRGAVAALVRFAPFWGVAGVRYRMRQGQLRAVPSEDLDMVREDDLAILWTVAHRVAVALYGVTPVPLADLLGGEMARR